MVQIIDLLETKDLLFQWHFAPVICPMTSYDIARADYGVIYDSMVACLCFLMPGVIQETKFPKKSIA